MLSRTLNYMKKLRKKVKDEDVKENIFLLL
jgi:hypothetical protein